MPDFYISFHIFCNRNKIKITNPSICQLNKLPPVSGYPLHNENRKWGKKIPDSEFVNFAKTHGIWFVQVVNFLILKVKDISIFAAKISIFWGAG